MYIYKINLIDGKSYLVQSEINNVEEFSKKVIGIKTDDKIITCFKLAESLENKEFKSTNVIIISTSIISIEFISS